MTNYQVGDKVRCTSTWTTHVVDRGEEYTVDDVAPGAKTILVNAQWVPITYFEKVEPVINWAEIAGTSIGRAVNAERRAEKAEARAEKLELERSGWARRIDRVEAQVSEWEKSAAQPYPGAMRDWQARHAAQIRAALKEAD